MLVDLYEKHFATDNFTVNQKEQYEVVVKEMTELANRTESPWRIMREDAYCKTRGLSMLDGAIFCCLGVIGAEFVPDIVKAVKVKVKKRKETKSEEGA